MLKETKLIRVEQSYFERIERLANEGKRPIGSQIEILLDYYEGMQKLAKKEEIKQ